MPRQKLIALLILIMTGLVSAQVYKWVDEEGRTNFGDKPPETGNPEVVDLPDGPRSRSLEGHVVDGVYVTWDGTIRVKIPHLAQPGAKVQSRDFGQDRSGLFMYDDFGHVYILLITKNSDPPTTIEDFDTNFSTPYVVLDQQLLETNRGKELRLKFLRKGGSHLRSETFKGGKLREDIELDLIDATSIFLAGSNQDIVEVTAGITPIDGLSHGDRKPEEEVRRLAKLAEERLEEFLIGVEID